MPALNQVHINSALTSVSAAIYQSDDNFVFNRVFPMIPVQHQSDEVYVYSLADMLRLDLRPRALSTESAGSDQGLTTKPYATKSYALHKDIDDRTRANLDSVLSPDIGATKWLTGQVMMHLEKQFVSKFMTAGTWGIDYSGVASNPTGKQFIKWSDHASTPIQDVKNAVTAVKKKSGIKPNAIVLATDVFDVLTEHADILERVKYGGGPANPANITAEALAAVFGLKNVFVTGAVTATSNEGATALTTDFIAAGSALLVYVPDTAGVDVPMSGAVFSWNVNGSRNGWYVTKFRVDTLASDRIEVNCNVDMQVMYPELGAYFGSAI